MGRYIEVKDTNEELDNCYVFILDGKYYKTISISNVNMYIMLRINGMDVVFEKTKFIHKRTKEVWHIYFGTTS